MNEDVAVELMEQVQMDDFESADDRPQIDLSIQ